MQQVSFLDSFLSLATVVICSSKQKPMRNTGKFRNLFNKKIQGFIGLQHRITDTKLLLYVLSIVY